MYGSFYQAAQKSGCNSKVTILPRWLYGVQGSTVQSRVISKPCKMGHTDQAPLVQKKDSTTYWINHYPVDKAIGFNFVLLICWINDLSGG